MAASRADGAGGPPGCMQKFTQEPTSMYPYCKRRWRHLDSLAVGCATMIEFDHTKSHDDGNLTLAEFSDNPSYPPGL